MKETIITCDVIGCKEEGCAQVECCWGWKVSTEQYSETITYKKFEKPLKPNQTDLCEKHYQEWSRKTCKLLKMDKERKE